MNEQNVAMPLQNKYCEDTGNPKFAPITTGKCYSCGKQVTDKANSLITGCDKCHRSFCD